MTPDQDIIVYVIIPEGRFSKVMPILKELEEAKDIIKSRNLPFSSEFPNSNASSLARFIRNTQEEGSGG